MRRIRHFTQAVGILLLLVPGQVFASPAGDDLLIAEVQTGTTNSASEEFVELYNPTDQNIDISHYKVEYYSAASDLSVPSRSIPLHGTFYAGKHYLLASTGYLSDEANDSFSAGFSKTGGHLFLVSPDPADATQDIVHDIIGWGTALHPETAAALSPPDSNSLQRKTDADSHFIDTDNNAEDFTLNPTPNPESDNIAPDAGSTTTPPPDQTTAGDNNLPEDAPIAPIASQLQPLAITELLPNPAPPASDSTDEYVEIYNPNSEPIDLSGYKLQTGNSYSYSHTFTSGTIAGGSYEALTVTETGALLANSGGKARLIDPSGAIISETPAYDTADDGQAWALVDGSWAWTTTPTPNEANILTVPLAHETSATTSNRTTKKPSVKGASTKKSTSTKKTTKAASGGAASANDTSALTQPAGLHPGVLAGVSILAVGYAAYEYRHDIGNRLYQFRRYREARRQARTSTSGR